MLGGSIFLSLPNRKIKANEDQCDEKRNGESVWEKIWGDKKKMKKKTLVLVRMALCTLLLISPALASSVDTLEIYGNANEDDTIDMRDLTYVKLIFFGKKPETELADAKYDGKINPLDFIQIKLIIVGKEKELTIVDTADRTVTVKKPIEGIVVAVTQHLEPLRLLKVQRDIIVGRVERFDSSFFPELGDVPSVGFGGSLDIEKILDLHPDAVFISSLLGFMLKPTADSLESAGITVLCFHCQTPAIHREEVKKLGYIFDKEEEAEEYLDWREEILNSVKEKVEKIPEEDKPKVYFAPSFKDGVYYSYGQYAYIAETGGKDIFADQPGSYMSVDPEVIIERNPDIIVRVAPWTAGGYGVDADDTTELKALREEIMSRPELQNVAAVKNERIYIIANHLVSFFPRAGCKQFLQIVYQAKWFHPELFVDLDPEAIHQEYLTRFQGLDYDLNEYGVFLYPLLEE
jgi:iron complex transport system substrate-binding protein